MRHLRNVPAWLVGFAIGSAAVLGVGIVVRSHMAAPPPSNAFWDSFRMDAVEEQYGSITEMAMSADAVVVGRIDNVRLAEQWNAVPEWGDDGLMTIVAANVQVEEAIRGQGLGRSLELRLFLPDPHQLTTVLEQTTFDRSLFFLHKDQKAGDAFVLLSTQGYLRDRGTTVIPEGADPGTWLSELSMVAFEDVVDSVRP